MVQEPGLAVRRFLAWTRLYNLLEIEPGQAPLAAPELLRSVAPTIDFAKLLLEIGLIGVDFVPSGTGDLSIFTVPAGERLWIHNLYYIRASGDRTVDAIRLQDDQVARTQTVEFFTADSEHTWEPRTPFPIDEGDQILVTIVGGGTDGTFVGNLWVSRELIG